MKTTKQKMLEELREQLANIEHDRWAKWQAYLFSKSEWTKDGYLIPKELCKHWQRQIDTPYSKLSEKEKDSDRKEVDRYLPLLEAEKTNLIKEICEIGKRMKINLTNCCREEDTNCVEKDLPSCSNCSNAKGYNQALGDFISKIKEEL